jgi:hypothetical protein
MKECKLAPLGDTTKPITYRKHRQVRAKKAIAALGDIRGISNVRTDGYPGCSTCYSIDSNVQSSTAQSHFVDRIRETLKHNLKSGPVRSVTSEHLPELLSPSQARVARAMTVLRQLAKSKDKFHRSFAKSCQKYIHRISDKQIALGEKLLAELEGRNAPSEN